MENLQSQRETLGLSQLRLAQLSDVSRFKISVFEAGDGELTADEKVRIRAALETEAQRRSLFADALDLAQEARGGGGLAA